MLGKTKEPKLGYEKGTEDDSSCETNPFLTKKNTIQVERRVHSYKISRRI